MSQAYFQWICPESSCLNSSLSFLYEKGERKESMAASLLSPLPRKVSKRRLTVLGCDPLLRSVVSCSSNISEGTPGGLSSRGCNACRKQKKRYNPIFQVLRMIKVEAHSWGYPERSWCLITIVSIDRNPRVLGVKSRISSIFFLLLLIYVHAVPPLSIH